jgi:DNA-binding LacI/PurR family transcriptional regulator
VVLRSLLISCDVKKTTGNGTNFLRTGHSITRTEVAKLAGVSHMTVTRALSGHPNVSPKAKAAVLAACQALNYRRNTLASSLRRNRSNSIGVLVPTFNHSFYGRMLTQLEMDARQADCHLIVGQGDQSKAKVTLEWADIEFLLSRQIDGLVVDMTLPPAVEARLAHEKLPLIFVNTPPQLDCFDFVGTQDEEGMEQLVNYLIGSRHQRIAFLAGFPGSRTGDPRLAGYKKALHEHDLAFDPDLVIHSNFSYDGGYAAAKSLLKRTRNFTAVAGVSDYVAIGAMAALNEAGLSVPKDISVGGFCGDENGAFCVPALTTVAQPIEQIASKALEILRNRITNPSSPLVRLRLPGRLLMRASCGPVAH